MLDGIRNADFAPQRKLAQLAESQLGTVGSGNHYVNVMEDEQGRIWVGVHFGSRGFGHKTASGFLALAQGLRFGERAEEGEMDSPPVLFEVGSELGESYVAAMELAGEYAYAGRDVVVAKVLEILGAEAAHEVHNHHNFAWREEHFGRTYWVIRKGCTPARPGQEGSSAARWATSRSSSRASSRPRTSEALYSTVHGAGRVMSRSQAAGGSGGASATSAGRDCERIFDIDGVSSSRRAEAGVCPDHPESGLKKVWVEEQVKPGVVDWPAVQARLRTGHRARRRRRGRGAGGVQAPAGGARRARRHDPREAHAPSARRRHGRP